MRTQRTAIATTLISVVGLGISIYLTIAHYAKFKLACSSNSIVDCEAVTHSKWSVIFGIPVPVFGLLFFVAMAGLSLPVAWRTANRLVHLARLGLAAVGMGMVVYLLWVELFWARAICLWCSSVHVLTFVIFVIVAATSPRLLAGAGAWDGEDGDSEDSDEPDDDPDGPGPAADDPEAVVAASD